MLVENAVERVSDPEDFAGMDLNVCSLALAPPKGWWIMILE